MNTKHTPGPWAIFNGVDIYPDNGDKRARHHIAEVSPEGYLTDDCDITSDEHKANARLIAAAPDLLAAGEKMLAHEQAGGDGWWKGFKMLKAAIAKATRETI